MANYKIVDIKEDFGFRSDGDGRVVYLFVNKLDFSAIEFLTDSIYTEMVYDGETQDEQQNLSQYEPSTLLTDTAGELDDEVSFTDLVKKIKGKGSQSNKFISFVENELFEKGIPLVFIDSDKMEIYNIDNKSLPEIVEKYKEKLVMFIREYDCRDN